MELHGGSKRQFSVFIIHSILTRTRAPRTEMQLQTTTEAPPCVTDGCAHLLYFIRPATSCFCLPLVQFPPIAYHAKTCQVFNQQLFDSVSWCTCTTLLHISQSGFFFLKHFHRFKQRKENKVHIFFFQAGSNKVPKHTYTI